MQALVNKLLRSLSYVIVRPLLVRALCPLYLFLSLSVCTHNATVKDRASARLAYDMGVTSLNKGDLRGALGELLRAVDLDPTMPEIHNALGLAFHATNHLEDSLKHYQESLRLKPKFSEASNNLGTLYIDLGQYDKALECFNKALSDILYSTPYLAEGNLGWAYYKKGDKEQALKHLRNAVAMNNKFCRGYSWLARIGLDTNEPLLTIANGKRFEKHCKQDPEIASLIAPLYLQEMSYYLGISYLKQGDKQAAKEHFLKCANKDAEAGFSAQCAASLALLNASN